jgi:nitrate/TMAO reductase-like tetraheme cytochrome c subunit
MRKTTLFVIALMMLATALVAAQAADYIGASKCKMCHKVQYTSWESLSHAKAFDRLTGDEQSNPDCLKCHATGGSADMPGVQCEACHGPGSDYKSMKVMKDRDASVAAGLIVPNEDTCKGCHVGAPHDQKPFDYATAKEKGVHEHKTP